MNRADEARVLDELQKSRKYRHVCADTLSRVATWALARHGSYKDAVKAAKRKLHQVYGAYLDSSGVARVEGLLESLRMDGGADVVKETCLSILQCHASTSERIAILPGLFPVNIRETGIPRVVVDVACGLNPFALPWMGLPPSTEYFAYDIDERLTRVINAFLGRVRQPGAAFCQDMLVEMPGRSADVVFLLKTLPCLEQQEKGVSAGLLERLLSMSRLVVLSFPAQSLGGRNKGMPEYYAAFLEPIAQQLGCDVKRLDYPTEVFFLLRLRGMPCS